MDRADEMPDAAAEEPSSAAASRPLELLPDLSLEETVMLTDDTAHLAQTPAGQSHRHHHTYLNLMGEGAMGQVYLAKDRDLQRKVAIKTLHDKATGNREVLRRFFNEMQITAQLEHPNVVPIYGLVVAADGSIGYSMKVVKGKTLKDLLAETRSFYDRSQPPDAAHDLNARLHTFLMVCDAMAYAHNKGIIHRDLKPANIMLGAYNEVYVMDWGIARLIQSEAESESDAAPSEKVQLQMLAGLEGDIEATRVGQILGTPRYMSPQQAAGKNHLLDGKSDQFALGLILFELVTLKPAIQGANVVEVVKKILKSELEPFQHYAPKVKLPRELLAIVSKATAPKPEARYASVFEMAHDLRQFLRDEPIAALPTPPLQKLLRWLNRHRMLTLSLVMGLFLLSAASTISNLVQQQQDLLKAQQREQILTRFLDAVGHKSQQIDTQFLSLEMRLEALAAAASATLNAGTADPVAYYLSTDFSSQRQQPPDFAYASHYGKMISLDWPAYQLAPQTSPQALAPLLAQVYPLRQAFKHLFLETASQTPEPLSAAERRQQLMNTGTAVSWAYLALAEGVEMSYPGKTGYPAAYDPRQQPWYRLSAQNPGIQWGSPHIDLQGQGLVLSCTRSVFDKHQRFRGVAGLDLTFDYIIKHWMSIQDIPGIQESFLLNREGEIVIRSSDSKKKQGLRFGEQRLDAVLDTPLFPQAQVLQDVRQQKLGYFEYQENSRNLLVAYYPITSINWYYVVLVNGDELFRAAPPVSAPPAAAAE